MKPALRLPLLFGAVFLASVPSGISAQGISGSHTYYIDFNGGSDSTPGTSSSTAWRHAPGDPQASGVPANVVLVPGDTILFRAGVVYRGSIPVKFSGSSGKPITYSGQGWGNGHAIISGRDAFNVVAHPCSGSPVCSKVPGADQLVIIDLPVPVSTYSQIVLDGHILQLSEAPKPEQAFWFDDVTNYVKADTGDLEPMADGITWRLRNDFIGKSLGDDAEDDLLIMILGYPNAITSGPVTKYDQNASTVLFQPARFRRDQKAPVVFALANHPRLITRPYEYATVEHGKKIIVYAPLTSTKLEVSRRAWGFTSVDQKNIAIKGFEIEGFADGPQTGGGSALAVRGVSDLVFDGNDVHDLENWAGGGAIGGQPATNLVVTNNRFRDLPHGSGIRVGKITNLRIERNEFDNIGRTGILIMNSEHAVVDHNILRHLYGSHGNAIAIYLANHDVVVSNNLVTDSTRAVTFEGVGHPNTSVSPNTPNSIVFRANLLKGVGSDGSALQSWGGYTSDVTIEQNVLLVDDGMSALRLSGRDSNVVVRRNIIDGYQGYPMPLSADTTIAGNIFVSDSRGPTAGNDEQDSLRKPADAFFNSAEVPDPKLCTFLLGNSQSGVGPNDTCKVR